MIYFLALNVEETLSVYHWNRIRVQGCMNWVKTNLMMLGILDAVGLLSESCGPSVVMIGFRFSPLRLFFPPLPFAALFATKATCLALLIAAFLRSPPFVIAKLTMKSDLEELLSR